MKRISSTSGSKRGYGRRRGRKSDIITLIGQETITASTGGSGNGVINTSSILNLDPVNLGSRPQIAANIFSRYRFKRLQIKYVPQVGSSTAGAIALGIIDDTPTAATAELYATYAQTVAMRKSSESQIWQRTSFSWSPVDQDWLFTTTDLQASRFEIQAALVVNGLGLSASTTYGTIIINYEIQYKGALTPDTAV